MIDLKSRAERVAAIFGASNNRNTDNELCVLTYRFEQQKGNEQIESLQRLLPRFEFAGVADEDVHENKSFDYKIFIPANSPCRNRATILLHGLNERSWNKYYTWGEALARQTEAPVILFPIAFHINRTPSAWSNPRQTIQWLAQRRKAMTDDKDSTFANVTLSTRISEDPLRFYISGKETCYNLWQLIESIRSGLHPCFDSNSSVNLFGYSIGAMVAQVMMMANPDNLLDESRLFIFMGGSIFSKMQGDARDILDSSTMNRLHEFYLNNFVGNDKRWTEGDSFERAFEMLMLPEFMRQEREEIFGRLSDRIHTVTMKNDRVMTTQGAIDAFGADNSTRMVEEWDFPFNYSHQIPFPVDGRSPIEAVTESFDTLFGHAGQFLLQGAR